MKVVCLSNIQYTNQTVQLKLKYYIPDLLHGYANKIFVK